MGSEPSKLLFDAINSHSMLQGDLTAEQRIKIYETIETKVDQIMSLHPGSDESLKIISNQSIGEFNYKNIQTEYYQELFDYYENVCRVEPSNVCLGFTSLQEGIESCRVADSFSKLDTAHNEVSASLYIFIEDLNTQKYSKLSLNEYRNCLNKSEVKKNDILTNYFNAKLVRLYTDVDQIDKAKAVIQKLTDPYSKFSAIMDIKVVKTKSINQSFAERMWQYIDEKEFSAMENINMQQKLLYYIFKYSEDTHKVIRQNDFYKPAGSDIHGIDRVFSNAFMTGMTVAERKNNPICRITNSQTFYDNSIGLINAYRDNYTEDKTIGAGKKLKDCEEEYRELTKKGLDKDMVQVRFESCKNMRKTFPDKFKKPSQRGNYSWADSRIVNASFLNDVQGVLGRCENGANHGTALMIYSVLLGFSDKYANEFKDVIAPTYNYSKEKMLDHFLELNLTDKNFLSYNNNRTNRLTNDKKPARQISMGHMTSRSSWKELGMMRIIRDDDHYREFRIEIANSSICNATDRLYKKIKGTDNFSKAVKDLKNAPKKNCGDAELEKLLN